MAIEAEIDRASGGEAQRQQAEGEPRGVALREEPGGVGEAHDDAACRARIDEDPCARLCEARPENVSSRPELDVLLV
eukprot:scaffold2565_cov58-Phaeocystis_antarctica.AAC.3